MQAREDRPRLVLALEAREYIRKINAYTLYVIYTHGWRGVLDLL